MKEPSIAQNFMSVASQLIGVPLKNLMMLLSIPYCWLKMYWIHMVASATALITFGM